MKLILDLDEETLENMQAYAEATGVTLDQLVTELFNRTIHQPFLSIQEIGMEEVEHFRKLLVKYVNEAIYDIEESAGSTEAYDTDLPMADVFRKLIQDHLDKAEILVDLYQVFTQKNDRTLN